MENIKQQLFQKQLSGATPLTKGKVDEMMATCDGTFQNDWVPGDIYLFYFNVTEGNHELTTLRYADLDRFLEQYELWEPEAHGPDEKIPRFKKKEN